MALSKDELVKEYVSLAHEAFRDTYNEFENFKREYDKSTAKIKSIKAGSVKDGCWMQVQEKCKNDPYLKKIKAGIKYITSKH